MDSKDFLETVKLFVRPRYTFAAWVACSICYLLMRQGNEHAGETIKTLSPYFYALWIFFFVLWIVEMILIVWDWKKAGRAKQKEIDDLVGQIQHLNAGESYLLAKLLCEGSNTKDWPSTDSAIYSLTAKKLATSHDNPFLQGMKTVIVCSAVWSHIAKDSSSFVDRAKRLNPDKAERLKPTS